ncbi:MAG TPA: transcription termination factor Rho [Blastocatellia bacterium]|nr:transcription termination factor Rho [Blastocatellia bacterium]
MDTQENASGVLQIEEKGHGYLRLPGSNYMPRPKDVVVSRLMIQKFSLREGAYVEGHSLPSTDNRGRERFVQLVSVDRVNGLGPEDYARSRPFTDLVSIDPTERLELSRSSQNMSMRVIDIIAPIGKGTRGLIVAPPKTGKTTLMEEIADAVANNHPEAKLVMLLVDERPEEVTHMKRHVRGEVVASSADQSASEHLYVTRLVLERVKRMVEAGQDVVVLLDSITRLARASNRETNNRGKTMSGGVDSRALEFPRKFFGAARKAENGGSLTIMATALIDTGSQMDEIIFQEFKGTGNLEIVLDRRLAERRIFPAIDISKSGTRKEEKLFGPETLPQIYLLRRGLASKKPVEAMEALLKGLNETKSNQEFFDRLKARG